MAHRVLLRGKRQAAGLLESPGEILEQRCRKLFGQEEGSGRSGGATHRAKRHAGTEGAKNLFIRYAARKHLLCPLPS